MNLKHFLSRNTLNNLSRFTPKSLSSYNPISRNAIQHFNSPPSNLNHPIPQPIFPNHHRRTHTSAQPKPDSNAEEEDGPMDEFLSRFVWIMRGKLSESYPDCDKQTIDGMLLIIVGKVVSEMEKGGVEHMLSESSTIPSQDFSEDLWRTVWEVSNMVLNDMTKAKKREKMKDFVQNEEVKEMYRFAGEVGVRGDMLRELRFKWAREKMEETEFYEGLQRLREEDKAVQQEEEEETNGVVVGEFSEVGDVEDKPVTLPKRHGKIKYKIYGLDLSGEKWQEIADKIHESGEVMWPQEAKAISGKCKLVTERIFALDEEDDLKLVLDEWKELLQPSRIDWIALLDQLKEKSTGLYLKVAEHMLDEESYQTSIRDYSKLIDAHAKENRLEDAERILKKMNENGMVPDSLTSSVLVHMYSKSGNLNRAIEAYESLRSQGFLLDMKVYTSMIISYANASQPKSGEAMMREMEAKDMQPTKKIYMALLRSFAELGHTDGALRISNTMQFAGIQADLESCTLLVQAWAQAGDPDQARYHFDYMMKLGHRPDDRCTASMVVAYSKRNLLDKALDLLSCLEKDGFQRGVLTDTALVDWFGKLQLVDEAEQIMSKISEQGETPPFKLQISLCEMYSTAGLEKKMLQTLGIVENKKEDLGVDEYERIVKGLIKGGFLQDARRMYGLMEAQGFAASETLKVSLMASNAFRKPTSKRY